MIAHQTSSVPRSLPKSNTTVHAHTSLAQSAETPRNFTLPSFDKLLQSFHGSNSTHQQLPKVQNNYSFGQLPPLQANSVAPIRSAMSSITSSPLAKNNSPLLADVSYESVKRRNSFNPVAAGPIAKKQRVQTVQKPKSDKPLTFEQMTSVFVSDPNFESSIRKYKCEKCDKRFKTVGHLSRHKQIHSKTTGGVKKNTVPQQKSNQTPEPSKMCIGNILA